MNEVNDFVAMITARIPDATAVRIGMAVPEGLAADESFAESELLTQEQMISLVESAEELKKAAFPGAVVDVTDMRYYVPYSPLGTRGAKIAHVEPDGQLRAFGVYEAKVGNLLEEPFDILWARAIEWRNDPFVVELTQAIQTPDDWARVARVLDRRFGSEEDKARIALRALKVA